RRVGSLLLQRHVAVPIDAKLVPPDTSGFRRRIDRMHSEKRLAIIDPPIHEPRHDLVALRVESRLRPRLRHAVRQLSIAQVMIGRYDDLLWPGYRRLRRILPIDVEFPDIDAV